MPTRFGEFVVPPDVVKLGAGSFGSVLRVEHTSTKRVYAAKIFMDGVSSIQNEIAVYLALAKHDEHPSFQGLVAFNSGAALSWFVYPWCPFGCLASLIHGGRVLEYPVLHGFGNQVRSGLVHLHGTVGWLHLDLKPANILWNDSTNHAYIVDFSLSEPWPVPATRVLQKQYVTEPYRPPELLQVGQATVFRLRPAVDAWSLGCVLAEAYTGRRLFSLRGATIKEQVEAFLKNPDQWFRRSKWPAPLESTTTIMVRRLLNADAVARSNCLLAWQFGL